MAAASAGSGTALAPGQGSKPRHRLLQLSYLGLPDADADADADANASGNTEVRSRTMPAAESLVGRRVSKVFPDNVRYEGAIVLVDDFVQVRYDDNEVEDYTLDQVDRLLLLVPPNSNSTVTVSPAGQANNTSKVHTIEPTPPVVWARPSDRQDRSEENEWRANGSHYIGQRIMRSGLVHSSYRHKLIHLHHHHHHHHHPTTTTITPPPVFDSQGRVMTTLQEGKVVGWLDAHESDYFDAAGKVSERIYVLLTHPPI